MCIMKSLCCALETNTTLQINSTATYEKVFFFFFKEKTVTSSVLTGKYCNVFACVARNGVMLEEVGWRGENN